MIPWLRPDEPFPPVAGALRHPNGLLCASVEVTPERLLDAYRRGIFPWYSADEPVLWWSPDPRMVLLSSEFHVTHSLRKKLRATARGPGWQVHLNRSFAGVMQQCAVPRPGQDGTWITAPIIASYSALHVRGLAHSFEVWDGESLVGGLYGVSLGRMFYGESMFSRATDASKIALATLVRVLLAEGVPMIDCQQNTSHLASLGGREIPRADFLAHVDKATRAPAVNWQNYANGPLNRLLLAY